ncbi:hypothetical protein LNQ52_06750 [Klebsiella pneumoniae subsp. pneumoniae]|nr:hypothetical protein [Klebsiella pneumoniae subsp. pneumoniae]
MAYIPVWLNGKCYIGTIFSHHGAYRHGVDAEITLSSPREDEGGHWRLSHLRTTPRYRNYQRLEKPRGR